MALETTEGRKLSGQDAYEEAQDKIRQSLAQSPSSSENEDGDSSSSRDPDELAAELGLGDKSDAAMPHALLTGPLETYLHTITNSGGRVGSEGGGHYSYNKQGAQRKGSPYYALLSHKLTAEHAKQVEADTKIVSFNPGLYFKDPAHPTPDELKEVKALVTQLHASGKKVAAYNSGDGTAPFLFPEAELLAGKDPNDPQLSNALYKRAYMEHRQEQLLGFDAQHRDGMDALSKEDFRTVMQATLDAAKDAIEARGATDKPTLHWKNAPEQALALLEDLKKNDPAKFKEYIDATNNGGAMLIEHGLSHGDAIAKMKELGIDNVVAVDFLEANNPTVNQTAENAAKFAKDHPGVEVVLLPTENAAAATLKNTEHLQQISHVIEEQSKLASIRTQSLSNELRPVLEYATQQASVAAKAQVFAEVYSGGQCPCGCGGPRTGSTRHDNGNAADLKLFTMENGEKKYFNFDDPQGREVFKSFVTAAHAAGATGIGAAEGYMGPKSIHVGFGTELVWGAGGKAANAPDWLRSAFNASEAKSVDVKSMPGNLYLSGAQRFFYADYKFPTADTKGPIDRSQMASELKGNPSLIDKLAHMVNGETSALQRMAAALKQSDPQKFAEAVSHGLIQAESAANRAAMRGHSLAQALLSVSESSRGYYAGATYKESQRPDAEQMDLFKKYILGPLLAGSNEGQKRFGFPVDGNASAGVAANGINVGRYARYAGLRGETYVLHGEDAPKLANLKMRPPEQVAEAPKPESEPKKKESGPQAAAEPSKAEKPKPVADAANPALPAGPSGRQPDPSKLKNAALPSQPDEKKPEKVAQNAPPVVAPGAPAVA